MKGKKQINQSAITGRFVSENEIAEHPESTITQTVKAGTSVFSIISKLTGLGIEFDMKFRKDKIIFWGEKDMSDAFPKLTKYMLNGNYQIEIEVK